MMQRPSDERLVAFLDGEVDEAEFDHIQACLEHDAALRDRLALLSESTELVREAFAEILHEPVPERLIAACAPEAETRPSAEIVPFASRLSQFQNGTRLARRALTDRRWWAGLAAASVAGIMFGGSVGYLAAGNGASDTAQNQQVAAAGTSNWLDNIATYHNLFIQSANGAENTVFDVPAGAANHVPADVRIPDLKPWSLAFQGARKIVVDGKPAFQFFYRTDKKEPGPITLFVTTTARPDMAPNFERRDNVNMLYWRHQGHGYAIVGQADKGWLWGLANDIAWQLKAI